MILDQKSIKLSQIYVCIHFWEGGGLVTWGWRCNFYIKFLGSCITLLFPRTKFNVYIVDKQLSGSFSCLRTESTIDPVKKEQKNKQEHHLQQNFQDNFKILKSNFESAIVLCSRFIWITNSSDHRRVWTASLLHTKQLPKPLGL